VSGGGAHLHIHITAHTKWGKGVELHSRYLWHEDIFFQEKKNV